MKNEYLKTFIADKGLTIYRFAKNTGLQYLIVSNWVNGKFNISPKNALKIKAVYPDFDLTKAVPEIFGAL